MAERKVLPHFPVPAYEVYTRDTLDDGNYEAKVVVQRTGIFGLGTPLYIAPYSQGFPLAKGERVIKIHNLQKMYYPYMDHSADFWVNGRWVSISLAELQVPPREPDLEA